MIKARKAINNFRLKLFWFKSFNNFFKKYFILKLLIKFKFSLHLIYRKQTIKKNCKFKLLNFAKINKINRINKNTKKKHWIRLSKIK